jgi:hypothetical protein
VSSRAKSLLVGKVSTMFYRVFAFICVVAALLGAKPGLAENRLRIEVWPHVSTAPANVRVRAIVVPNVENRALQVSADSGQFFRSSYVPLSGIDAATVTETTLKNLPGGAYEIAVALVDAQGRQIVERATVMVASNR